VVVPYTWYRPRGITVIILPIPTVITAVTALLPHSPLPCHSLAQSNSWWRWWWWWWWWWWIDKVSVRPLLQFKKQSECASKQFMTYRTDTSNKRSSLWKRVKCGLSWLLCQINKLSAEVAHLHSQLEKGGVVKQNLEYELVKVNQELAAERRQRLQCDAAAAETAKNLHRMWTTVTAVISAMNLSLDCPSVLDVVGVVTLRTSGLWRSLVSSSCHSRLWRIWPTFISFRKNDQFNKN